MKKTKKIAIIFAILVLIGSVAFGAVYYFTDMFKTPKQAFYQYLNKAAKVDNSYSYQEMLEDIQASKTKSYKSETSIGVELNSKGINSPEAEQMMNILKNVKLKINTEAKPSEKKSTSNISLNYGTLSAGNVKFVRDNDTYGVQSDLLDNKYLAVENRNLKDLMNKLGIDASEVPNKFEELDLYDLLYISKEDQEKLENTYKDIFKNGIPENKFIKHENVTQTVNGEDINTKEYKLSLDESDFIDLMIKLFETVKEDDTLLNILVEKMNKIIESSAFEKMKKSVDYSLPSSAKTTKSKEVIEKVSKADLQALVNKLLQDLKYEQDYAGYLRSDISIYVANNDVAKIVLKASNETLLSMEFFKKDDKNHIVMYVPKASDYDDYNYDDYEREDYNYSDYINEHYLSDSLMERKTELQKVMEIEYNTSTIGDKTTAVGSFTMFKDEDKVGKFGFDITSSGKIGQGKNETSAKLSIEADKVNMALVIDSTVEYTDNVNVESLNDKNANILNNMTKQEIDNYFAGMAKKFDATLSMFGMNSRTFYPTKKQNNEIETDIEEQKEEVEKKAEDTQKEIEELQKQLEEKMKELQQGNG